MKQINTFTATVILTLSTLIVQNKIANAQSIEKILCLDESIPGGMAPEDKKIIIFGNCNDIIEINGLYKGLEDLMRKNSEYKNMHVIILGRELKKNHKLTPDSSPYTDIYYLKVDFNEKSGVSSITKEYTFNPKTSELKAR